VRQWWRQQRSFAEIAALGRRNATGVWLYTHNGSNFADRFPRLVEAVKSLRARSCFIDGEAIVVDANFAPLLASQPRCHALRLRSD
jgi:ATP-dependent DNA ligase